MNDNESETTAATDSLGADFITRAEGFRLEGLHSEALVVLLKGLSENPTHHQARLLLARVFFELGCVPFALNEIRYLSTRFPENANLQKLFRDLGGGDIARETPVAAAVIAESEIDFDAIEDLDRE